MPKKYKSKKIVVNKVKENKVIQEKEKRIQASEFTLIAYCDYFKSYQQIIDLIYSLGFVKYYAIILHNRDFNITDDGNIQFKKPHFHIIFKLDTRHDINYIATKFNTQKQEVLKSQTFHDLRYMIHLDNTEKVQYLQSEIVSSGIDLSLYIYNTHTLGDGYLIDKKIMNMIVDYKIQNYTTLVMLSLDDKLLYEWIKRNKSSCIQYINDLQNYTK